MDIKIFRDHHDLSAAAADIIIDIVQRKPDALLCFATGNTPVLTYGLLAEKAAVQKVDFSKCFCIGLDEWLGVPGEKTGSCKYILQQQVFNPLGIGDEQVYLFDGMTQDIEAACKAMNNLIDSKGGIDCMLAGIGLNGHIGFNEPGVDISLQAHEQELHTATLASGQNYFDEPTPIKKGITLGMAQVMKAGSLLLLANGESKAAIIKKALEETVSNKVPASFIQQHENGLVLLDEAAASGLTK